MSGPASAPRSQTAHLRARLAAMPATRSGSRDPFRFAGTPRTAPRAAAPSEPAPVETAGETRDIAARPPFQLIGIGEDQGDGQPARTAIIAGMNQVFLVREGERLALRFQVKRIGADAVELDDLAAGETFRIALR
jgi:hypothetical protein